MIVAHEQGADVVVAIEHTVNDLRLLLASHCRPSFSSLHVIPPLLPSDNGIASAAQGGDRTTVYVA
jgi:hypothetical protein